MQDHCTIFFHGHMFSSIHALDTTLSSRFGVKIPHNLDCLGLWVQGVDVIKTSWGFYQTVNDQERLTVNDGSCLYSFFIFMQSFKRETLYINRHSNKCWSAGVGMTVAGSMTWMLNAEHGSSIKLIEWCLLCDGSSRLHGFVPRRAVTTNSNNKCFQRLQAESVQTNQNLEGKAEWHGSVNRNHLVWSRNKLRLD